MHRLPTKAPNLPPQNLQRNGQGDEMDWLFDEACRSPASGACAGCWKRCWSVHKVLSNQASGLLLHLRSAQWLRQMLLHSVPRPQWGESAAAVTQGGMPQPNGAGFAGQAHSGDGGAAVSEQGAILAASGAACSAQAHSGDGDVAASEQGVMIAARIGLELVCVLKSRARGLCTGG